MWVTLTTAWSALRRGWRRPPLMKGSSECFTQAVADSRQRVAPSLGAGGANRSCPKKRKLQVTKYYTKSLDGFCEHGNEPSRSIKRWSSLDI
jgi:hypothetical protein